MAETTSLPLLMVARVSVHWNSLKTRPWLHSATKWQKFWECSQKWTIPR